MAGGLEAIYPRRNAKLAEAILDKGGVLISEQTFGVPAIARNLVQRDRLQSGLSVATFVMQTDIKGGSMHTVRFTLLQERLLFAPVPRARHALEPKSQGILAMTQMSAREFSKVASASGNYQHLLMQKFGDAPVAIPLASGKITLSCCRYWKKGCPASTPAAQPLTSRPRSSKGSRPLGPPLQIVRHGC